ncbi:MAG: filamentous hemagglutinin N-terminal domain-containing protein, partial [Moorea sp. SIO2B7]|nr:filamentous hemagglutinin N-terminal domain-containing protein [Moorena sp. SIO2B7]
MPKISRTNWRLGIASRLIVSGAIALTGVLISSFSGNHALAQITPDNTLPNNSVVPDGCINCDITGGTQVGDNLFHSFEQFSIPTGGSAIFLNNDLSIENILSRVTGGSISNIDGLIQTLGTANFFLINPNGIIFGPNATLDIGGSFAATTADGIQLGDNGLYSASDPGSSSLLTVNPSAFLFNQVATAQITIQSNQAGVDLRVPTGENLWLVGGDVNVDNGILEAFGGRIEIGGLSEPGTVELNTNTGVVTFPDDIARADVTITNESILNVGSQTANAGVIKITGGKISLTSGTQLSSSTFGLGDAGVVGLFADSVVIDNSTIFSTMEPEATGEPGGILIQANSISLQNEAKLLAETRGIADAGLVILQATGSISLDNAEISSNTSGVGRTGNILLQADNSVSVFMRILAINWYRSIRFQGHFRVRSSTGTFTTTLGTCTEYATKAQAH